MSYDQPLPPDASQSRRWLRLALVLAVIGIALWSRLGKDQRNQPAPASPRDVPAPVVRSTNPRPREQPEEPVNPTTPVSPQRNAVGWNVDGGKMRVEGTVVSPVVVHDQAGRVQIEGEVDLADTLSRIDANRKLKQFNNDGSTFGNYEGLLPKRPRGRYREWVHPTPGIGGPGPQRVVSGSDGSAWYTPDHYQSFIRVR